MMIRTVFFLALACSTCQSVHAHNGHIASAEPVNDITIDGDLSDWPSEMKRQFIASTIFLCDGSTDRDGFKGSYRVGCNYQENALYVAFEIEDDTIVLDPIGDEEWSARDGCEIFLSLEHQGDESLPVQYVYRDQPASIFDNRFNEDLAKQVKAARASDDNHLVYEWRIDLTGLSEGKCELAKGATIGFDVAYLDRDSEQDYAFYSSSSGVHKHLRSHQLGDLIVPAKHVTKLVRLAGQAAWADGTRAPLKHLQLQSVESEDTFFQLPLTPNGQFMLSLPPGNYAVSALGGHDNAATQPQQVSVTKDTLLAHSLEFEKQEQFSAALNSPTGAVVHFDLAHGQRLLPQLESLSETLKFELQSSDEPIETAALQHVDLLYLLGPTTRFTETEKTAVIEFVSNGGALLLVMDESRRSSLEETQANDLIAPFGLKLTDDTEYVHNCGAIARSGPIQSPCELPFSGGRAVEGGFPFGFQLDQAGNPSHPFAASKTVDGGGRVIVLSEAMAAIFLGSPEGERLSGTPRDYANTNYWGKDSERFNAEILTWLLASREEQFGSQADIFGSGN